MRLQQYHFYHVYNRGNNRETIFREDKDYLRFLQKYAYYIEPVCDTYAFCLLPNHFHFLIRVKTEEEQCTFKEASQRDDLPNKVLNPSTQFAHLFASHTNYFNLKYQRQGSLFTKNFRDKEITNERYFVHVVRYIHRNPQHHGLVAAIADWRYSSFHLCLNTQNTLLKRTLVLEWFGGLDNFKTAHQIGEAEKW